MSTSVLALGLPNPIDIITDVVAAPVGWAFDKVTDGITKWVIGAVAYFVGGVADFLLTSARPDPSAAWFAGPDSSFATVRTVALSLLGAFVLLGIIQSLAADQTGGMIRRVAADLPAAVLGMVATTEITGRLIELTDAMSAAVLSNTGDQAVHFLSGSTTAAATTNSGFAVVILGLVVVIAGLVVWVELMVRSVLVYILVAVSPLAFAAMVWPTTRGVLRRLVELLIAVIVSKLVICITLATGVAALSGAGNAGDGSSGVADQAAVSMGTLFVGAAILAMAAFAPFLVLRLIPVAEAAVVAQGMSRSPMRALQATAAAAYSVNTLGRLAGGGSQPRQALTQSPEWYVNAPSIGSAEWNSAAAQRAGGRSIGAGAAPNTADQPEPERRQPPRDRP